MKKLKVFFLFVATIGFLGGLTLGLAVAGPGFTPSGLKRAMEVQAQHTSRIMKMSGVVGTAITATSTGEAAVSIFTERPGVPGLPYHLNGVPVVVKVTGKFYAVHHCKGSHSSAPECSDGGGGGGGGPDPGTSPDPTDRFERPVPIGVSTGNEQECAAGTVGARVTDGTNHYALSNNHVYARENDGVNGSTDEEVLQPGRFDTNCATDPADVIGTLADHEDIDFSITANNEMDAAIASATTDELGNGTPPDGYGIPTSQTVAETIDQAVQKYGRTTGLTTGTVTDINGIVNVGYTNGTARFVNQIVVKSKKPFLKLGDSGSLLVTDPDKNPVGLLFASNRSGKLAIANPIDPVLARFGVTIDGE